jgi:hypothetical protein
MTDTVWPDLGISDLDQYVDNDCSDADEVEEEVASHAEDGSTQNVENQGDGRFDLGTSDVDGYECEHGNEADVDDKDSASQAEDGSTQNVAD